MEFTNVAAAMAAAVADMPAVARTAPAEAATRVAPMEGAAPMAPAVDTGTVVMGTEASGMAVMATVVLAMVATAC
jgi:hypothetical protein